MALNPKTLEKVPVGRKVVVKFKVGRLMKQKVAELSERLDAADAAQREQAGGSDAIGGESEQVAPTPVNNDDAL